MRKITFLKTMLLAVILLAGSGNAFGQGTEDFESQTALTASYATGNFTNTATGITWSYANSRNEETYSITNKGIMLRYADSNLEATIPGGVGNFSFQYRKAFTGTSVRQLELLVNGTQVAVSPEFGTISGAEATIYNFSFDVNTAGTVTIKIKNVGSGTTNKQSIIDNISWTVYSGGGTPTVATPTFNPPAGTYTSSQSVEISTTTATSSIYYTTNGSDPDNVGNGTLYSAAVPVNVTTTLKARAYATGFDPSAVATAIYTINPTPTITVTEVTVPAFSAVVGNTDSETINISGANLTSNIVLTIDGANATMFSVNSPLPSTGGVATIIYTPTAAGNHTATLRMNSTGAAEETRTLSGTAILATPVATDGNGISQSGFTANWDEVSGATGYELSVYTKAAGGNVSDLFISEYVEGSSYNKAIEIYNGTGADVDLSTYSIFKQTNGAGAYGNELMLSGTLTNGDSYVIAYVSGANSASAAILAVTDLQTSSSAINFNGNDAVALFKSGLQIDEVGIFNQLDTWGTDVTLIRKSSAVVPKATYDVNDWTIEAKDYVNNLGAHSVILNTPIAGSPFTVTGANMKSITGLSPLTTYYYTVVTINGTNRSVVSNEIMVTTSPSTGLDNLNKNISVYTLNGNVLFNSVANQTAEIFNSVGQRIVSKNTIEGLNSIPVTQKGVMLVKVGNQVSKVIM